MKHASRKDKEELINTQYLLHNAKKWLLCVQTKARGGKGKNIIYYYKNIKKLVIN